MTETDDLYAWTVWSMTGHDTITIDAFLNDSESQGIWKTPIGQSNLAKLIDMREEAIHAYKTENMPVMIATIEAIHAWCRTIGYQFQAHPKAVLGDRSSRSHKVAASAERTLTKRQKTAIAKAYWHKKSTGEGYGATKQIAADFNITTQHVRNIAKEYPPN